MALRYYANAPATALTASCTALATTITVDSVAGLPITYPYTLIIDRGTATEEAVEVSIASGTILTVSRGIDGTTAFAHAAGAAVVHGITARDIREANSHINATSGVHGVTGDLVGTTAAQTLTNKTLDSPVLTGNPTAPTPVTADADVSVATTAFVKAAILASYQVGDIKVSTVNVNPSTYLGGTWVPWGSGRVPVGVDASQTEFNAVEKTGGAKTHTLTAGEMPAHIHGVTDPGHAHTQSIDTTYNPAAGGIAGRYADNNTHNNGTADGLTTGTATTNISIQSAGGGAAHNNLQPYITCYMFKRTA